MKQPGTQPACAWTPHDLCAAKLMAHREKDFEFVSTLVEHGLIDPVVLEERLSVIDLTGLSSDQSQEQLEYRQQASRTWAKARFPAEAGELKVPGTA